MSILTKPYEITVWEDAFVDGQLQEVRLGVIGSDKMLAQCRALEPTLVRNVNGVKTLTFKMYKHYVDNMTGEQVVNPFIDWLVSERKVKLWYDGKWFDFIIKDINENSSDYLYTYSLEDALVQELSKNGFGVTLDAELMNNIGDAKELGEKVLTDVTNWNVESEVFVQTVDEALVYVTIPGGTLAKHVLDQSDLNYGVTDEDYPFAEDTTVLAFYSSCKNKPHRFQFIYSGNGYDKTPSGYNIARKDDRVINQANCQYYIDIEDPENTYTDLSETDGNLNSKSLNLFLPQGYGDGDVGVIRDALGEPVGSDTALSSWYRGKRYGFAQQSVYVPVLERYCQKFKRQERVALNDTNVVLHQEGSSGDSIVKDSDSVYTKKTPYSGIKFLLDYEDIDTYVVSYTLEVKDGTLTTIGGHKSSFDTKFSVYDANGNLIKGPTSDDYVTFDSGMTSGTTIKVVAEYKKKTPETTDYSPQIFIQPNRGSDILVKFEITDLTLTIVGDYLGYTESEFVSPTLVQNCINDYKFESGSGWCATASTGQVSTKKAEVQNVYGRFVKVNPDIPDDNTKKFVTIAEEFYDGTYNKNEPHSPYMKMSFFNTDQFVLNSGIYDNRTMIAEMPKDEEWVLDYIIRRSDGAIGNGDFTFSLGEYIYNTNTKGYNERTGEISFSVSDGTGAPNHYTRKIFKVSNTSYTKDTFKKDSKIYLKIKPNAVAETGQSWYIQAIALYRKALDENSNIIVPDYEQENSVAAEEYVKSGTIQNKYHYFKVSQVEGDNAITNKEQLSTIVRDNLSYTTYVPVYNEGAKKVRTVTAKESNYFNILQSIAETFEAWLDLEVVRDEATGAILSKIAKFKNYIGEDNYASFRYGVNLNDIQRTYSSKNITTKLIVKQNSNELAENGFCTIQRAGANPTGENCIYDFQYYQNMGIMNTDDFLNTAYYLEGAKGLDAELWEDDNKVEEDQNYTLNGYYPRLKKINDAILPINEEIIGHQADLVQKKAQLEVAQATLKASTSGLEQTAEDFLALTGVYPEEAQSGKIETISLSTVADRPGIQPRENWWCVDADYKPSSATDEEKAKWVSGIKIDNDEKTVSIALEIIGHWENCVKKVVVDQATTAQEDGDDFIITKSSEWTGLYIEEEWDTNDRTYMLSYDIKPTTDSMTNIGCHNTYFNTDFSIKVWTKGVDYDVDSPLVSTTANICEYNFVKNNEYHVVIVGTCCVPDFPDSEQNQHLWIQPNRGSNVLVTCEISNILLAKKITKEEATKSYDRRANFYLNLDLEIEDVIDELPRTYDISCLIPAGSTSAIVTQAIASVDIDNSNVKKYIDQYTLYYEKEASSTVDIARIQPQITALETAIKEKTERRKTLLEYKNQLNKLFFQKYSRFILEGTWISEEYVDDDKYYADAQSVLYNSCYPQVAYNINVLSLKGLPGYELVDFDIGDKTYAIDEKFFGEDYQEEVIITEMSEMLDDPSKNSIKVQNFKNQFQDLFQKITATVQQTQYNVGTYEKGATLVDANLEKKNEFITNAINGAQTYLSYGQTVKTGPDGITITDDSDKQNSLRMVGGAILFSTVDPETQETTWMTGVTKDGISANLITAGRLDTGAVQIMSGDSPVFRWDAYGISAYDALWTKSDSMNVISGINSRKFVRFDKNGIYGINNAPGIDGATWHPSDSGSQTAAEQIDENATFALTWEGLKVTGSSGVEARIGRLTQDGTEYIMNITKGEGVNKESLLSFSNAGTLTVGDWSVGQGGFEGTGSDDTSRATYNLRRTAVIDETDETTSDSDPIVPKIFLSAKGREVIQRDADGIETQPWEDSLIVFRAGENFHVTEDGVLYALAGKIGDMEIGDIAGKSDVTVGQNLAVRNSLAAFEGTLTDSEYHYTIVGTNPGGRATGLCIGKEIFEAGNDYVVSFNISFVTNSADDYEVAGHHSGFTINKIKIDDSETDTTYGAGVSLGAKDQTHSVSLYVTFNGGSADDNLYIQPNRSPAATNQALQFIVWNLKVEKGTTQTPWVAPLDAVSSNSSGSYSWRFSPSDGIQMWNGAKIDDNEVFRVNTSGLRIKGEIIATSGRIGGMEILAVPDAINNAAQAAENAYNHADNAMGVANNKMDSSNTGGTYKWQFDPTNGFFMKKGDNSVLTINDSGLYLDGAINCTGSSVFSGKITGTEINNLVIKAGDNFGVSAEGMLYCNDIRATGGELNGLILGDKGILFKDFTSMTLDLSQWASSSLSRMLFDFPLPYYYNIKKISFTVSVSGVVGGTFEVDNVYVVNNGGGQSELTPSIGLMNPSYSFIPIQATSGIRVAVNRKSGASWLEGTCVVSLTLNISFTANPQIGEQGFLGRVVLIPKPHNSNGYHQVYIDDLGRLCY